MSSCAQRANVKIAIASDVDNLADRVREAFEESSLEASYVLHIDEISATSQETTAEVVLADPGAVAPIIETGLPNLKWLQSTFAGVNVFMDKTKRRDYKLSRIGGVFGPLMAEYVLAYVLQQERGILTMAAQQEAQVWDDRPFKRLRKVSSLTLAVLGVGDIGQTIAERAKGLGMRTVGFKRGGVPVPHFDATSAELADVLQQGHYIVSVLPSTPGTRGLLSGDVLRSCQGATLINVGRGDVVDEESILKALEHRWISKAILDVFPTEPLPVASALWKHPDVIITPHVSAVSFATDVADIFVRNLERHLLGKPLEFAVDWAKGY